MIRSIFFTIVTITAVLWAPWWVSTLLFLIGIMTLQAPALLLIPACVADYIFASHTGGIFSIHLTLIIVAGLLIVRYSVLAKTRIGLLYTRNDFPATKKTLPFS